MGFGERREVSGGEGWERGWQGWFRSEVLTMVITMVNNARLNKRVWMVLYEDKKRIK